MLTFWDLHFCNFIWLEYVCFYFKLILFWKNYYFMSRNDFALISKWNMCLKFFAKSGPAGPYIKFRLPLSIKESWPRLCRCFADNFQQAKLKVFKLKHALIKFKGVIIRITKVYINYLDFNNFLETYPPIQYGGYKICNWHKQKECKVQGKY